MKTSPSLLSLSFLAVLAISPWAARADGIALSACPAPVQKTIEQNLRGGTLDEIESITIEGRTLYVADVDLSRDHDLKIHVAADGALVRLKEDIDLSKAPEAVRDAAKKLVPAGGRIDDVDKESAGGKVTYHVEIDRPNTSDLKVVFSPEGAILSQREDHDD